MAIVTEDSHGIIDARHAEGIEKYGKPLDDNTPIDPIRELQNELADALQYFVLIKRRWQLLRTELLAWHAAGHDLPARALELLSHKTTAEEIESDYANSKHI